MIWVRSLFVKSVIYLLVFALFGLSLPHDPARAAMVPTEAAIGGEGSAVGGHRARVQAFLSRADVRAQLEAYGVDPVEVRARVESLSDEEVILIAGRLDDLPAGGYPDPFAGEKIVAGIVLIILLIAFVISLLIKQTRHNEGK